MTTFQIQVQIGGETKTFITGAIHQGEATSALARFLETDIRDINILKITSKPKITFVPPLNGHLSPAEMAEGMMPDESDIGF